MTGQGSRIEGQVFRLGLPVVLLLAACCLLLADVVFSAEKWPGVDKTVVERYAQDHGREAREPFINTDQGDLLLFIFLISGAAGGFVAGYYWRVLLEQKTKDKENGNILGTS